MRTGPLSALALLAFAAGVGHAQPLPASAPAAPPVSAPVAATPAPAAPVAAKPAPRPATTPDPVPVLRKAVNELIAFLSQQPPPPPRAIAEYLDTRIAPMFDFGVMAKRAAGRFYRTLSPRQRAAMTEEMKRIFLTGLIEGLMAYDGQKVRFQPPRISPDGKEAMVTMHILNPGSLPGRVDFRVEARGPEWRIVDIVANGSSAVIYYRRMLARELVRRAYEQAARHRPAAPPRQPGMRPPMPPPAPPYPQGMPRRW